LSAGEAKPLEAGGKANELNYESISWFGLHAPLCCSAALAAPQLKPHPKENKGIDANKPLFVKFGFWTTVAPLFLFGK